MTREELKSYKTYKRMEKEQLQLVEEMRRDVMFPKATTYDGMPRGSGGVSDPMAEQIAAYLIRVEQYAERARECGDRCRRIEEAIDSLPVLEREICFLRYIRGRGWKEIAARTRYSESAAMYHHRKALRWLEDMFPED